MAKYLMLIYIYLRLEYIIFKNLFDRLGLATPLL